jgi:ABC-type branched-subunit amino acid transport system substrate-binding protein
VTGPARRLRAPLAALALVTAALTACSSAPPPVALTGPDEAPGASGAPGSPTLDPRTGLPPVTGPGGTGGGAPATTSGGTTGQGTTGGTTGGTAGTGTTGGVTTGGSGTGGTTGAVRGGSTLFTPAENTIGITTTSITMCAHAALTYGAAFNTTDADFNVFWSALNDKGGVFGRKVNVTYENDNYTAADATKAATACAAKKPFMILGGIGFDQIPAVRNYVEQKHILYLHHTTTVQGSKGLKYSFTELPTVERMGESYAQLAYARHRTKKIGIIRRDSPNWKPGTDAFLAKAKQLGLKVVANEPVQDKQSNYTDQVLAMKNAGAELVFGWENALNSTQIIKQAKAQLYSPQWLVFGVNLMSQTLAADAMSPPLEGAVMYTPYSFRDYSGPFARYADDMRLFEAQYAKYRPDSNLKGVGGDLLFLNWTAQKALYQQFLACGKDCTRNRFVDVLTHYNAVPSPSTCRIDFTKGDGHHGADQINFVQAYRAPSGKVNFRNMTPCVGP